MRSSRRSACAYIGDEAKNVAALRMRPLHVRDHTNGCASLGAHAVDHGIRLLVRDHRGLQQLRVTPMRPLLLTGALLLERLPNREPRSRQRANVGWRLVAPDILIDAPHQRGMQ